jgi:hypothetical protein
MVEGADGGNTTKGCIYYRKKNQLESCLKTKNNNFLYKRSGQTLTQFRDDFFCTEKSRGSNSFPCMKNRLLNQVNLSIFVIFKYSNLI